MKSALVILVGQINIIYSCQYNGIVFGECKPKKDIRNEAQFCSEYLPANTCVPIYNVFI